MPKIDGILGIVVRRSARLVGNVKSQGNRAGAIQPGPRLLLVPVQAASSQDLAIDPDGYCLDRLLEEVSTSINTTAAGGNASLMALS